MFGRAPPLLAVRGLATSLAAAQLMRRGCVCSRRPRYGLRAPAQLSEVVDVRRCAACWIS
eukprot:8916588-Alexandrium_andersonii.AAC.1